MKCSKYSAVIIGSGISGLYAALKLEQQKNLPEQILLITKSELGESNSRYAQGGMVAVLKQNTSDSVQLHISDTIKAGAGLSEEKTIEFISQNSDNVVNDLLKFGVNFDRESNGDFKLTKEAAHSVNRILHAGGDATGRQMELELCKTIKANSNIKILENTTVVDLLVKDNECAGIVILNKKNEYETIFSDVTIIATGGLGQLYKYTTNPIGATGDGLALCYNAGAIMQDMEFVQFHPTALAFDEDENRFLISEAVRGEGAKLCDSNGYEFMHKYHEKKELAPRDIVARSICQEMQKNNIPNVYLNATGIGADKLLQRFPTIAQKCSQHNVDITKDLIPVAPAAHYFMGGVKTDIHGKTSIKNLYAIGEVASTGLHGANRLASNSLLECVVCAHEIGTNLKITKQSTKNFDDIISKYEKINELQSIDTKYLKTKLQQIMWSNVGIYRNEKSLNTALEEVLQLKKVFEERQICSTKEEYEFKNMLTVAEIIIISALNRKESRGAHYRTDFLNTNTESFHSLIKKDKGEINFVK